MRKVLWLVISITLFVLLSMNNQAQASNPYSGNTSKHYVYENGKWAEFKEGKTMIAATSETSYPD
jgi:hypothetical protein